ncbi:sensor histidine kinase [Flectobacillus roseus]|uniref:sensor histidine kinase n=1 Tax=Flectobacillus roseus TaxID=502259 RepID=UPI0024B6D4EF|nr:HAMP domain-containing sensor histidine kinase [Flectobacillus roseus]MDI9868341.1 HAMP domain-containing sensor histidine kinase [Flectobacillus roseus]
MKKSVLAYRNRRRLEFVLCFLKTLLIFLLFEENLAYGQSLLSIDERYEIETFDESKGLISKDVNGLVFDKRKLGWLGNGDGLNIFDGKRVYKASDYLQSTNKLLEQPVKALIYDSTNNKLIVFSYAKTRTSIYVLHLDQIENGSSSKVISLISSLPGPLTAWPIYQKNLLAAIINSNTVFWDLKNFNVTRTRVCTLSAMALYTDIHNQIYLAKAKGYTYRVLLNKVDIKFKFVHKYTNQEVGYLWEKSMFSDLKCNASQVYKRAVNIEKILAKYTHQEYITKKITGIVTDPLGNYYLCGHDWGLQKLTPIKKIMKTLTFNRETRGICYSPQLEKGAIATPIGVKPFSLNEDSIRNIFENDEYYFNASVAINDSLRCILPLYPQSDSLRRGYVYNVKNATLTSIYLQYPSTITDYINVFQQLTLLSGYRAKSGVLYIGTNYGLCVAKLKGAQMYLKPLDILPKEHINDIVESFKKGCLLLATETGIYEVDIYTRKVSLIQEGAFLCLLRYTKGWVAGSRQNGAYLFSVNNQLQQIINIHKGIHSNTIYCISFDNLYQTLWLGTSNGVSLYQLPTGLLKTYFKKDGIANNEFNKESYFNFPNDSLILMGGLAGITAIRNRAMFYTDIRNLRPSIWGVDAIFDNNQQQYQYINEGKPLVPLSAKLRKLVFHVADYASSQQLYSVKYRVDDSNWQTLNKGEDIELLNVDAGNHQLEVKAITADGKISQSCAITYYVEPIWYKSWWGISLFVLLGAILMIPVFLIRNRIVQVKAKEELYKNREKLFGMIAHDLRSPLSAYQGLAGVVNYLISKQEWTQLQKIGQEIDDTGRHLDLMLNNLLNWSLVQQKSLKPIYHHTTIGTIIHEMLPVYKTVAGSKDITLDKNIDKEVTINTDANLSALIIRNLLDNAVKNAPEKSTIKIEITKKDKKLTLLIENDFHEHKLPVVTDIVANINDPEWELKRGVGLKFVMQTLKLLKASIQVSILNNKNRIRWYVEIPEP